MATEDLPKENADVPAETTEHAQATEAEPSAEESRDALVALVGQVLDADRSKVNGVPMATVVKEFIEVNPKVLPRDIAQRLYNHAVDVHQWRQRQYHIPRRPQE